MDTLLGETESSAFRQPLLNECPKWIDSTVSILATAIWGPNLTLQVDHII
jgi:hypothetical protein